MFEMLPKLLNDTCIVTGLPATLFVRIRLSSAYLTLIGHLCDQFSQWLCEVEKPRVFEKLLSFSLQLYS